MNKKTNLILKQVLEKVNPSKKELIHIKKNLDNFLEKFNKQLKKFKINAELFAGGSFAKKTAIKKNYYDVDVFVRFDKKYKDNEISNLTAKVLKKFVKGFKTIHGSRDYFRIKLDKNLFLELIPVIKIKSPKQARNITDMSYSHVNYIKKKIKNKKILDEIKIAKAFCHANKCYGAESYINGFSGYSLELLTYNYGNFLNLIKEIAKIKNEKIIIDIEKHYRNKQILTMDMNSSKLQSPIVLIDPTYKQRNALAALSDKTFRKFQEVCKKFLKSPNIKYFEIKETDLNKIKQNAGKKKLEFILIEIKTNKQEGDVAGSKLFKFHNFLIKEISRFFDVKNSGFGYGGKKSAKCFYAAKSKKEILIAGPDLEKKKNVKGFKKVHKKTFVKGKKIYAREKINFSLREFVDKWKKKNKRRMKEMSVREMKII